ncbi:hypothetical protein E8E15_008703 [Penicillium rubens]|nr:hypothetical protein E8E15_008703 [Penicillium rubens]
MQIPGGRHDTTTALKSLELILPTPTYSRRPNNPTAPVLASPEGSLDCLCGVAYDSEEVE